MAVGSWKIQFLNWLLLQKVIFICEQKGSNWCQYTSIELFNHGKRNCYGMPKLSAYIDQLRSQRHQILIQNRIFSRYEVCRQSHSCSNPHNFFSLMLNHPRFFKAAFISFPSSNTVLKFVDDLFVESVLPTISQFSWSTRQYSTILHASYTHLSLCCILFHCITSNVKWCTLYEVIIDVIWNP